MHMLFGLKCFRQNSCNCIIGSKEDCAKKQDEIDGSESEEDEVCNEKPYKWPRKVRCTVTNNTCVYSTHISTHMHMYMHTQVNHEHMTQGPLTML